jgi:hypothetical protein
MGWRVHNSIPGRGRDFFLLWAHPTSYSMGIGRFFLQGRSGWRMKLTFYLHLVTRLKMSGAMSLPLPTSSWHATLSALTYIFESNSNTSKTSMHTLCKYATINQVTDN